MRNTSTTNGIRAVTRQTHPGAVSRLDDRSAGHVPTNVRVGPPDRHCTTVGPPSPVSAMFLFSYWNSWCAISSYFIIRRWTLIDWLANVSSKYFAAIFRRGGSVAEWLACWTQAQKASVQIAAATLSGNSLRQTVQCSHPSCLCSPNSETGSSPLKGREGNCGPGKK